MVAPGWLAQALACVMVGTAAYCLGRLIYASAFGRRSQRGVDATHAVMGMAMAGMLVPSLRTLSTVGWTVVFATTTTWFTWTTIRPNRAADSTHQSNRLGHVVASAAMVYMVLAMPAGPSSHDVAGSMGAMASPATGSAQVPALGVILGLCLLGCAWWTALRLSGLSVPAGTGSAAAQAATTRSRRRLSGSGDGPGFLAPRVAACCDLAIGVVMAYLLIGSA